MSLSSALVETSGCKIEVSDAEDAFELEAFALAGPLLFLQMCALMKPLIFVFYGDFNIHISKEVLSLLLILAARSQNTRRRKRQSAKIQVDGTRS